MLTGLTVTRYGWFTLCETWNNLLCHCCWLITFSKKGDDTFVRTGWKNALRRFVKHEASNMYREAAMKLCSVATVNIAGALNAKRKEQQLQKHLMSVRYLARQGLAIRGHEESEGNTMQLLPMCSVYDADIKGWPCTSWTLLEIRVGIRVRVTVIGLGFGFVLGLGWVRPSLDLGLGSFFGEIDIPGVI